MRDIIARCRSLCRRALREATGYDGDGSRLLVIALRFRNSRARLVRPSSGSLNASLKSVRRLSRFCDEA
jgi:hypothetical protein